LIYRSADVASVGIVCKHCDIGGPIEILGHNTKPPHKFLMESPDVIKCI